TAPPSHHCPPPWCDSLQHPETATPLAIIAPVFGGPPKAPGHDRLAHARRRTITPPVPDPTPSTPAIIGRSIVAPTLPSIDGPVFPARCALPESGPAPATCPTPPAGNTVAPQPT